MKQEDKTSFCTITFVFLVGHVNFSKSGISSFLQEENVIAKGETHNYMAGTFRIQIALGRGSDGPQRRTFSVCI